jgi:hypothetical protein
MIEDADLEVWTHITDTEKQHSFILIMMRQTL